MHKMLDISIWLALSNRALISGPCVGIWTTRRGKAYSPSPTPLESLPRAYLATILTFATPGPRSCNWPIPQESTLEGFFRHVTILCDTTASHDFEEGRRQARPPLSVVPLGHECCPFHAPLRLSVPWQLGMHGAPARAMTTPGDHGTTRSPAGEAIAPADHAS
jgi:hypothetical protein